MNELAQKKCVPCEKGAEPLKGDKLKELTSRLGNGWQVIDEHHLKKEFKFKDFAEALAFTNRVGEVAEKENHHPDILLTWGKVTITLCTHSIDGLAESDFILAAKADQCV